MKNQTLQYFQPPEHYFWRWAENGNVLEFKNGSTIAYREDFVFILKALSLPADIHAGTILLLLCACKEDFDNLFQLQGTLHQLSLNTGFEAPEYKLAAGLTHKAFAFLKLVNNLPMVYRSGTKRIALCQAVLEHGSQTDWNHTHAMLQLFNSGELDHLIFNEYRKFDFADLWSDLNPLVMALEQFPDVEALELKLRTGINALPAPAKIALPAPEPEQDDLMGQLTADANTAGIAWLARKVMAALNIPMHLSGSSDQSVGGVSDISNRGHFDKLLLSELAQDDLLLTARLAHNEALFLQREQLPANQQQQWNVLLDTTLKMWGLPRVFGLATALAFSQSKKQGHMQAWALGGKQTSAMDLATKGGIIHTLEQLDAALHCGRQLHQLLSTQKDKNQKYILITGEGYREDAAFMTAFLQVRDRLDYLAEVSRTGHIALYHLTGKRHKLVNQALINLNEVLFTSYKSISKKNKGTGLPAMLAADHFPLLFPASKIKLKHGNTFKLSNNRVVMITRDNRVLYWTDKGKGAIELVDVISNGSYYCGENGTYLFILVSQFKCIEIYQVDTNNCNTMIHQTEDVYATEVRYVDNLFYIKTRTDVITIDPMTGRRLPGSLDADVFKQPPVMLEFEILNHIKKIINNGYCVINSAKSIYLHTGGRLFIDSHGLEVKSGNYLFLTENKLAAIEWTKPVGQENMVVEHLPNLKFTKFTWPNGSQMVLDSRGLLHLKSADSSLTELSLLLVLDKPTACWAADGTVCGSPYFLGPGATTVLPPGQFYQQYIQPFIDALK
ncbi:hypothetical protein [Mucilaginibacter paludis]|uniref:Uncharacterized protein n=1 Tax=Mucilaginibacter paludis DSM 18603 TaxID=714943 RepID=H1YH71_9SPHI|nr:hypothetical protein [Mucilaginibacter paludis]EHQ24573.1 hypothetical protein Mucpa_0377 [Mucilaginibacter paludis DSM 18603]